MSETEQWTYIIGGSIALLVAAGVVLYLVVMVVRLIAGLTRGAPTLLTLAREPIPVGTCHRATYGADGRPHGLWLAIDGRWQGERAWLLDVELRVQGARTPITASFPLGRNEVDTSITSPLVSGITAVGGRTTKGFSFRNVVTTMKLCDVVPATPGAPIVVDVKVRPRTAFEQVQLALLAAPDPPMPALPHGLG